MKHLFKWALIALGIFVAYEAYQAYQAAQSVAQDVESGVDDAVSSAGAIATGAAAVGSILFLLIP